jgi:hypothetical protein
MQIEQLQQQWHDLDNKLERMIRTQSETLRLTVTQSARRRMNRMAVWPAIDVALCLVALLVTGSFLADHWGTWSLVGPAAVVMLAAIALVIGCIRQLVSVSEINWDGPVVHIQSALSRLSLVKIRQFKWVILLAPLVGFCVLIVAVQWLLDWLPQPHFILDKLNPWWIAANYAFGILFVVFGHVLIRLIAKRFGGRGWWQRALDDISGSSMQKARADLDRWANLDVAAHNAMRP